MAHLNELSLGASLRRLRLARGLSLEEAARRGNVAKASLGAWEVGTRKPRGPALARMLDALGADARTKARLLSLTEPAYVRIALADFPFGTVHVGRVLRAMRERRGTAQADLARRVGVSQATVSRWESGDDAPSPPTLHALGFALGATVEETLALASAAGLGDGGLPDDPEAAVAWMGAHTGSYPLREASFLGCEAELGRRAAWDARWDPVLVLAISRRAAWLVEEERYAEIAPIARRAIRLATTTEARLYAVPAIAALADADRRLGRGHAEAAELAGEWAAGLPDSLNRAWMLRQRGMSLARMGRIAEGLDFVARSAEMDLRLAPAHYKPWPYLAANLCEAHLEAGEPRAAAAILDERPERGIEVATLVRVGHANGRAATGAEMADLRLWAAYEAYSRLKRRRYAQIELRQSRLLGEPPETTDPVPDDIEGLARPMGAVLRENPR